MNYDNLLATLLSYFLCEVNTFAATPVITVAMTAANIDLAEKPNTDIPNNAATDTMMKNTSYRISTFLGHGVFSPRYHLLIVSESCKFVNQEHN